MAHTYQWLLVPLLTICVIHYLIQFKDIWFSRERDNSDLIFSEVKIIIWILAAKLCICFDNTLERPWYDGAFGGISIKSIFLLSIALTVNTVISYEIFGSNLVSLVCLLVLTLIEIWILIIAVKLWQRFIRTPFKAIVERVNQKNWMSGRNKSCPQSVCKHVEELLGKRPLSEPLGSNQFAVTYQTGYSNEEKSLSVDFDGEYAFKVIDIKQYVNYHLGSLQEGEESEAIHKLNRDYKFLMQINHQNIARFLKVERFITNSGYLKRLVLFTKLAHFNLHSYLSDQYPEGVDYESARLWFKQIVDALHYMHCQLSKGQPIAHMNIKPENILFYSTNTQSKGYNAKLSECGLDLYFTKSGQITTDNNKYLISAPEYVLGRKITRLQRMCQSKSTDPTASDIYNLGVILVLLIKGKIDRFVERPKETELIREMKTVTESYYVDFSWKSSKNSVRKMFANKEDKHLFHLLKGMLNRKYENRFDILSVKKHPWTQTKQN